MKAFRRCALSLLLAAVLAGCVCAPATAPLTGAPSDEEIVQARRALGYGEAKPPQQTR